MLLVCSAVGDSERRAARHRLAVGAHHHRPQWRRCGISGALCNTETWCADGIVAGAEHEKTLLPGEMLLYESAALVHGRPYPLDGEAYANAFVHFRPESGWDYRPSQLLEDYLPTKLTVLNTVPLSDGAAAGGGGLYAAVGVFWCRGMRR